MCYKSITKKLTNTVDDMLDRNILDKIAGDGSTNKLKENNDYSKSFQIKILRAFLCLMFNYIFIKLPH